MRFSSPWLAIAASISLFACYAELPGSAPDILFAGVDAGTPGGTGGGNTGGTMLGGDAAAGMPGGTLADASLPDAGVFAEAGADAAATTCEGIAQGQSQQRTRYAELQVVPPATCKSETQTRTCRATGFSDWTGSYQAESCAVAVVHSCGSVAHGGTQSRQRYPQPKVTDYNLCAAETQTSTCNDGTFGPWSGTAQYDSCQVSFLGKCGLFSSVACEATTECQLKTFMVRCLGSAAHVCEANTDCVNTCVGRACTTAAVARGGACDDSLDCANATCTTPSGTSTTASCTANLCACGVGNTCSSNAQCVGTCVNSLCVTANTTCDKDDDCRGENKCIKSGPAATVGSCLLPDGKACSANAQCEHVCRSQVCDKRGMLGEACDASGENADCADTLVCRAMGLAHQCQAVAGVGGLCDDAADCSQGLSCAAAPGTGIQTCASTSGAAAAGEACVPSISGALQCASASCLACSASALPCSVGAAAAGGSCQ